MISYSWCLPPAWHSSISPRCPCLACTISEVQVVRSVRVLPQQCCVVSVKLVGTQTGQDMPKQLLLELASLDNMLQVEPALLSYSAYGTYDITVDNCTGFTHILEEGVKNS